MKDDDGKEVDVSDEDDVGDDDVGNNDVGNGDDDVGDDDVSDDDDGDGDDDVSDDDVGDDDVDVGNDDVGDDDVGNDDNKDSGYEGDKFAKLEGKQNKNQNHINELIPPNSMQLYKECCVFFNKSSDKLLSSFCYTPSLLSEASGRL